MTGEAAGVSPEIRTALRDEPHTPTLTNRQIEILEYPSGGLSSDQIAARLGISSYAVNQHLDVIRRKLGASSRAEAVATALRRHLLKS